MYAFMHACMYVCMYGWMYWCMTIYMYCLYVCIKFPTCNNSVYTIETGCDDGGH